MCKTGVLFTAHNNIINANNTLLATETFYEIRKLNFRKRYAAQREKK